MRTQPHIGSVLFGRARRLLLGWLRGHPDEEFFLRQLVRQTGLSPGSVQRELSALVGAGLVSRRVAGRQVYFRADTSSPVFPELRSLFAKTAGLADVLRAALEPLRERIRIAVVFGSAARGELRNDSDIDLMVVGDLSFGEVIDAIQESQRVLGREVNPVVYSLADFRKRFSERQHFVTSVLGTELLFVIGERHDLEAVGRGQQMVDRSRDIEGRSPEYPGGRRSKPEGQRRQRHQP